MENLSVVQINQNQTDLHHYKNIFTVVGTNSCQNTIKKIKKEKDFFDIFIDKKDKVYRVVAFDVETEELTTLGTISYTKYTEDLLNKIQNNLIDWDIVIINPSKVEIPVSFINGRVFYTETGSTDSFIIEKESYGIRIVC